MYFYIILLMAVSLRVCLSEVRPIGAIPSHFTPVPPPAPAKCTNNTPTGFPEAANALQFRLPFMDMNIQHERNLHIMQEPTTQQLFVLHGRELYELLLSRAEKRLSLIGVFAGGVSAAEPIAAEIISWHKHLILAIAMEEYLEIYHMSAALLAQNAEAAKSGQINKNSMSIFEPIQQLTLMGTFCKLLLFNVTEEKVMLTTAVNLTKLQGRLRTFEWSSTFFDLVEDLIVPAVHTLNVIGTVPKYLISGQLINHQDKTVLTVDAINSTDLHLHNRQTLTVPSRIVHVFSQYGRNYLFGCTKQQKMCNTYRMKPDESKFTAHRQFNGNELTFDHFVAAAHFLVGARESAIFIYPTIRMNCYGSFNSNESHVSEIITYVNSKDASFLLLNYRRSFHTLLRIVEVEMAAKLSSTMPSNDTEIEDLGALQQHRHLFEETIHQLRSLLLRRKTAMDVFREVTTKSHKKLLQLSVPTAVHFHAAKIKTVRVLGETLQSPQQLLQLVADLRALKRHMRAKRATNFGHGFVLQIPRTAKVQRLRVENLFYNGSLITGFHLDTTTIYRSPILSVRATIHTKVLSTPHLLTRLRLHQSRELANGSMPFAFKVRALTVEYINNVPVTEFFDSLFLLNRDRKLHGRLILQADAQVTNLSTPLLNGLIVAQLFNLRKPQVVHSKLLINYVTVNDMQADLVNGLHFAEDVAFSGRDDLIEASVEIQRMNVKGDLLLAYTPKLERGRDGLDSQFQQFYTGNVIINGSLTIENLELDDATTTNVFVNGLAFSESILREKYLLHNTPQIIHTDVRFGNAKVTAPKLTTDWLNGHPTMQHLLNIDQPTLESPLLLLFMEAKIDGDVICNAYKSKLREVSRDAVRHGETANITGLKMFAAPLTIDHLITEKLNNLPANELVQKSQLQHDFRFFDIKSFDKLVVTAHAYVERSLNCTYINDIPSNQAASLDYYLKHLYLPYQLQANNIVLRKINGFSFDKVFDKLSVEKENIVLHKDLLIKGNLQFGDNLQVVTINGILWNDYVANLVRKNENAVIDGQMQFLQGLTIKNALQTPTLNHVNMQTIFNNVLSKSKPQQIRGSYTFGNVRFSNLDVPVINDIPTNTFIDTRSKEVVFHGDLIVPKLTVHDSLNGNFVNAFNFMSLNKQLRNLPKRQWRNLVVLGNAYWNESAAGAAIQSEELQYLYRHAVQRTGDQVISGNVHMKQPIISTMRTHTAFPSGVDLGYIARDCLLKNTTLTQTLRGAKVFHQLLQLQHVEAVGQLKISFLNKIDMPRFSASLYRISSRAPIAGPLHFRIPPIVGQLIVQGSVNGISSTQIYSTSNKLVPPVKINNLVVDSDLQISDINDMSLDYLLSSRITLSGPPLEVYGYLTFENLVLSNEVSLQSINGIPIDNLVFTKSDHMQEITGPKLIDDSLVFNGPSHIGQLNGKELMSVYNDNLTADQSTFANGFMLIKKVPGKIESRTLSTNGTERVPGALEEFYAEIGTKHRQTGKSSSWHPSQVGSTNVASLAENLGRHMLYLDFDFETEVLKQPANESVATTHIYDLQHVTMCQHRLLQVQSAQHNRRLFLTNFTTNYLSARAGALSVKAQNYCGIQFTDVKSVITVNGRRIESVFGMKKYIESIEMFTHNETHTFLLLHAIADTLDRNEIRMLCIADEQNQIIDWQSIPTGKSKSMSLFQFDDFTALLSLAHGNNQLAVSIYHFMPEMEQFKRIQVIDGPFNAMEMVAVESHHYQLLLSGHNSQSIRIYDYDTRELVEPYKLFQIIQLPSGVDKLHTFTMSDGELYMLAVAEHDRDFYHLYKYAFIQGWLRHTFGYFRNIQLAVPLSGKVFNASDNDLILLLCGGEQDECRVVKAFMQG